jgi:hypothetical protein
MWKFQYLSITIFVTKSFDSFFHFLHACGWNQSAITVQEASSRKYHRIEATQECSIARAEVRNDKEGGKDGRQQEDLR